MKPRRLAALAAVLLLALAWLPGSAAQKKEQLPPPKNTPYDAVPKPGPEHKFLASLAGTFTAKAKSFLDPKKAEESAGVLTRRLILDGLYLQEEYKGTSMTGAVFAGTGLLGYDVFRKQYVLAWADNLSTGVLLTYGTYDTKLRALVYAYEDVDIEGRGVKARDMLKIVSPNEQIFEMYRQPMDGKTAEIKVLEIRYTRR